MSLHRNLVAADDHMVVLTVPDPLSALRQHREILIADRGVHTLVDGVVGARISSSVAGMRPIHCAGRCSASGSPSGSMSMISTPTGLLARMRWDTPSR